jgi:hypothetical protein
MDLRILPITFLLLTGIATTAAAEAQGNQDVAKNCQARTLKAQPNTLPNTQATANLRQEFYKTCMDRGGKMDPLDKNQ